ncbi:MAG: protease modulator HflC [Clostridiaceae bacterium]|nr:protease modulator HflC [Clostridiaceae bacterium]
MNRKAKAIWILVAVLALLGVISISSSVYTVQENEYACTVRFSKIVNTVSEPGLYFKVPYIDNIKTFPKAIMLYDIPPSEVLTSDQKSMTIDSYVLWNIRDPLTFYQTLGSINEAELRLNALAYNALKNAMGVLEQSRIINQSDASERNDIYEAITAEVASYAATYGINVKDMRVKRLDLPEDNEQAVYARMISDRNQIAERYTADGAYEASIIRNDVDRQVSILVSDAEASAAAIEAEGEREYMRILAEAYNTVDKRDFYEFNLSLEALRESLSGEQKTIILGKDSPLARLLVSPEE